MASNIAVPPPGRSILHSFSELFIVIGEVLRYFGSGVKAYDECLIVFWANV